MPRPCPGATCCASDADCSDRCFWKCIGTASELPHGACPIPCGIRVNVPTPSTVARLEGDFCPTPGEDCIAAAPCNACYSHWDQYFAFIYDSDQQSDLPSGWTWNDEDTDLSDCEALRWVYDGPGSDCWGRGDAECPDIPTTEEWPIACGAEIAIDSQIEMNVTWDGECGRLSVKLINIATLTECEISIDPITGDPVPFPATTHTYEFEREWCDCEDLIGALSYVGVTSVNNIRGITVADPCNLASATITMTSSLDDECGIWCPCYECDEQDGTFTVNIAGGTFTGSVVVARSLDDPTTSVCQSYGEFSIDCGEGIVTARVYLAITCRPCEYYVATLTIEIPDDTGTLVAESNVFACGDAVTFTIPGSYTGCLSGHTISLS